MDNQGSAEVLLSLVPGRLARQFSADPRPLKEPRPDLLDAAVLFADISGFTALAEALARRGPAGVEELTRVLNVHFGRLIDMIDSHGGDITKFAGDALLALWPSADEGLSTVTCRAAQCGLAAQELFQDSPALENLRLSVRIGIGSGPVSLLMIGGLNDRWAAVATGDALGQIADATHQAQPGQVVLSPEAWRWVSQQAEGQPLRDGAVRLSSIRGTLQVARPAAPLLTMESVAALRGFVPPSVVSYLEQGRTDWIGELRRVTVLFVHFPGLTHTTPLERAQSVMLVLQAILIRYEGSMNKLSIDDKGAALVAALGLPPLVHEDDPARAVQAALEMQERLRELNVRHAIGVTTGRAFCGVVGNSTRREYTMIGDVVNLAARLMQAAPEDILCDEATYEAACARIAFESLPPITVKGKASPLRVFRPVTSLRKSSSATLRQEAAMVGRAAERSALSEHLKSLATGGKGGVVVIEGDAGIGKSRLIDDLIEQAQAAGVVLLMGHGRSVERCTPYFAWRDVFEEVCGVHSTNGEVRRSQVADRIATVAGPEWIDRAALVNSVLLTDFPETDVTAGMSEQLRSAQTHELLLKLLASQPDPRSPKVLILEDGHWMDSPSWSLALLASQRVPSLLLVLTTRPMRSLAPDEFNALVGASGTRLLHLEALPPDDAIRLVRERLGVDSLPNRFAAMILDKAAGNPLFCRELAYALKESGRIAIVNGEFRITAEAGELSELDIPGTVEAAIMSRIDRLTPSEQLVLKVASVIGRVFLSPILSHIYPIEAEKGQLDDMILELVERDMISVETPKPDREYAFKHVVIQTVAYNLMLFSQRRQLHRSIAEWLEGAYAGNLSSYYPLLAYHWARVIEYGASDPELISKAVDYFQKAGELALRSYANREAVTFLKEALRLIESLPDGPDRDRKELAIQCALGGPLIATRGFAAPETEKTFSRAWELCGQLGRIPERFHVLSGLWNFYVVATRLQKAQELAQELLALAETSPDLSLALPAHRALGETSFWLGDLALAREHLERVIAIYQPKYHQREAFRTGQDPAVVSLGFLSWTLWSLGYPDQSLTRGREALSLARSLNHPHSIAMALMHSTALFLFRRETRLSRDPLESVIALSREEGFQLWSAGATFFQGWVLSEEGKSADGIGQMCRSLEEWRTTGAEVCFPYYLSLLAGAYGKAGQPENGLAQIEDALSRSAATGEAWWRAELIRLKGQLILSCHGENQARAESCFREAIDVARQQNAKSIELRASCSLSRLWREQGRPDEARQSLADICGWFTEGFEMGDFLEAKTLLQEISER